jgi:hypothetical protein
MKAADDIDYLLSAAVYSTADGTYNGCGIVQGHAYTILSVF